MAKYVPDIRTQRWVIIAPARTARPASTISGSQPVCPFCNGNESMTPPEVYRVGLGDKNTPGWQVRVVPNLYPITDTHEVIIHSPDHDKAIEALEKDAASKIIATYRDRFRAHDSDGQVLIFCNQGLHAGASLKHPHSQLVVVPKQINLDSLSREPLANIVEENTAYMTYCPDFSQWPYEQWIVPKEDGTRFSDTKDNEIEDLSGVLQKSIMRAKKIYENPEYGFLHEDIPFGYNYYISSGSNWFIRIIPRFIHRAGFELGTGLNVNVIDPTEAAKRLKGMEV